MSDPEGLRVLLERLRAMAPRSGDGGEARYNRALCEEAADEIERLRGLRDVIRRLDDEIERLTARPADELLLEENKLMRAALLSQSDEIERLRGREQVGMIDAASNS